MNPYVAEQIKHYTGDNVAVNALAHAVWGGIAAEMAGNDATAGAVGAAGGELATRYIAEHYYGADTEEKRTNLSEHDKQELSLLGTLAAGLAGGVAGDSTSSAIAGAQAGKNSIENNAMSGLVPPRIQQDASLAFDPSQQGKGTEEIGNAIEVSHMGPSWGTEGKVHPTGQVSGDLSAGVGYTLAGTIDDNHLSVSSGSMYGIGDHAGASIGLSFGPYFPGVIGHTNHDYSFNAGAGVASFGLTGNKDGIGFSFGVGPSWGVSATEIRGVDVNGTSTDEIYSHDFK